MFELEARWKGVDALALRRDLLCGLALLALSLSMPWNYRDLAWALWTNAVWTSIGLVVLSLGLVLSGRDRSSSPIAAVVRLAAAAVGSVFGLAVVGALLSVFAANEPAHFLGPNGFINADSVEVLRYTSQRYEPVLLLALIEWVFAFWGWVRIGASPAARVGSALGKMTGALVISVIVGVALVALASEDAANRGLAVFYVLWFVFPWRILLRDSIQDQQNEGRPALYAGARLPLRFHDRAPPMMVLICSVLTLMFGGFAFTLLRLGGGLFLAEGEAGQATVLSLIGLVLLAAFVFLAFLTYTLAAARKSIMISREEVVIRDRNWEAPASRALIDKLKIRFRSQLRRASLGQYRAIVERVEHHSDSDGPSYDEFTLVLEHASDRDSDVVLYRAYHARHLALVAAHYAGLLRIPLQG